MDELLSFVDEFHLIAFPLCFFFPVFILVVVLFVFLHEMSSEWSCGVACRCFWWIRFGGMHAMTDAADCMRCSQWDRHTLTHHIQWHNEWWAAAMLRRNRRQREPKCRTNMYNRSSQRRLSWANVSSCKLFVQYLLFLFGFFFVVVALCMYKWKRQKWQRLQIRR